MPQPAANRRAFTLVELLVVIVILGILMAVAVPTFLAQQRKAQDTAAKHSLAYAYRVARGETVGGNGNYPASTSLVSDIQQSEPELTVSGASSGCSAVSGASSPTVVALDSSSGSDALNLWARSKSGTFWHLGADPTSAPLFSPVQACGSYRSAVMADSPTAYWRLDEASGTTAADSSGGGHTGSYQYSYAFGQLGLTPSDSDTGVLFSPGVTSTTAGRVTASSLGGLLGGPNLSAEAWINYAGVPIVAGDYDFVVERGWGAGGGWGLYTWYSAPCGCQRAAFGINDAGTQYNAVWNVSATGTIYLVGTYDGSTVRLYANGQQVASIAHSGTAFSTAATAMIGGNTIANTLTGPIEIDDVALYASALSAAQIQAHYAAR